MRVSKPIVWAAAAALSLAVTIATAPAHAAQGFTVNDPSTIKFAVQDNKVYFRNLNDYDSAWLPCCYNYYIDLTTEGGKAQFATFLSFRLAGKKLSFYKVDPSTSGLINIIGDF